MNHFITHWVSGADHWHSLPERLGGDVFLVVIIITLESSVGLMYLWMAAYWRKFALAANDDRAIHTMHRLKAVFIWCAIAGLGFRLIDLFVPAWPLWVLAMLILLYHTIRAVIALRTGLILVYKDVATLHEIRKQVQFVESSQMEMAALRDKLCELRNIVTTNSQQV